ncbi:MAG: DegV family protein [Actinomycetota bacterium]
MLGRLHENLRDVIAIVTDSAASLPPEIAAELGIEVVPMYLRFGDETYQDGVDLEDFYGRLAREGATAETATPAPGDFLDAFERTGADEIVCVTVAASLSGMYNAAQLAAGMSKRPVHLVDSGNASLAQGFVALEAARAARSGASREDVIGRANEVAGRASLIALIETFEFLRKSGRVKAIEAYAGTMLGIKPVFRLHRGVISPVARPRTRRRALERVEDEALSEIGGRPVHLAAVHAAAESDANDLLERIARRSDVVESYVAEFTAGMGARTGPGVVGVAFFCE